MNEIRISTPEELIQFVKDTDLPMEEYIKVVNAFYKRPFFPLTEDKADLLDFLEICKQYIRKGWDLPIFVDKMIERFNIEELEDAGEEWHQSITD